MNQGRIIVITGSPGTGKTTTASAVAKESDLEKSVHMHTDDFYHYLSKGAIPPHLPESNEQNLVVIEAFLEAAKRYVRGGYDVIVDGIVGPWFLEPWLNITNAFTNIAGKNMRNPEKIREDIFKTGGSSGCKKVRKIL